VKSLKAGDWVIPSAASTGTWRKQIVSSEDSWIQVPKDIPQHYAASISVNPCTAYRLLKDFVPLKAGDYIIQNAANSAVGMSVIQLAREAGIKTINVIRSDR
jgi:mitochondrial enoyl-[acyl-carrier protein] reductase / trans-2-enoyl-CoA reductase